MIRTIPRIDFTLVQLGKLNRVEFKNVAQLADRIQRAFGFKIHPARLPLDVEKYKLPNGTIDLETASIDLLKITDLPVPHIFITSEPFGDLDYGEIPNYCFSSMIGTSNNNYASVISTYWWQRLGGNRRLQPYLLFELAKFALDRCADLAFHDETRGCFYDYCDDPSDYDCAYRSGPLCFICEQHLNALLRNGGVTVEQIASVNRLFNRAVGKKVCFVAMPFQPELNPIYSTISKALKQNGWTVLRADELVQPRKITDTILQAILMSDLVVADISGNNPNVFYELGVAHSVGCDVILINQGKDNPVDITVERTISYTNDVAGRKSLITQLRKLTDRNKY